MCRECTTMGIIESRGLIMKKLFLVLFSIVFINSANAGDLSKKDMEKAWDCVGIYMANYFLPSGETFEYSMKEKSISSVKVWKTYALEWYNSDEYNQIKNLRVENSEGNLIIIKGV